MKTKHAAVSIFLMICSAFAATLDEYESALMRLKEGATWDVVKPSKDLIKSAKEKAFPSLLRHIHNKERASILLLTRDLEEQDIKTGEWRIHHPLIGEVAFDLIQVSIEGSWPKGYRSLYVITPENIEAWLAEHKNQSLREMQVACAKEALAKAEHNATKDPSGLAFIERHVKRVIDGTGPDE
jgi:hypothetical protein